MLKLIRKLDWNDPQVVRTLHNVFTKVWKVKYNQISLLAMLVCDLHRYHPAFAVNVVDQVLENIRRGLETNVYNANQQRVATVKYLGELYIYRMLGSSIIFDTFWTLVTFGHRKCPLIVLPGGKGGGRCLFSYQKPSNVCSPDFDLSTYSGRPAFAWTTLSN